MRKSKDIQGGEDRPIQDGGNGQFPDRLKMGIGDKSIRAFSSISGVSEGVIRRYLSGKSEPTRPVLIALADASNVTVQWLATGEGPMTNGKNSVFEGVFNNSVIDVEELFINTVIAVSIQIEDEPEDLYPPEILSRVYLDILKTSVKKKGVYPHVVKSILDGYISQFFVPYRDETIGKLIDLTSLPEEKTEFLKDQYWYNLLEEKFGNIVQPHPRHNRDEMIEYLRGEIKKMESKSTGE
ncbi:helix-turn-helix transcriptional regulator [Desulfuromonas acetoxidans]|uniref:Transcriptional regulator, XRE family n=1 Tax=Desulfuromonas acetoxidans (strain DSM 684 / 11070) TaxID=281689 RepID=Q1JYS2_DESA6|nr:helix-turn-helix transcriptional regulator [Desulfuromonas acetoxidans]EAT15343.1 transcriptional regulator, XRE family [Desulfuromonas acetoxidans DSM 684]MBF0646415.1 helix-turn-helix transcriptional regulator [Desulfuromonas acetoxidans]NVD24370.1 helix-turn-helix transcriptional regulator [Desulfuromonas acetoxidans]NVE16682.1 helix-turn-helix transcriptional regulator [Desulfuromonas acetoxidans]